MVIRYKSMMVMVKDMKMTMMMLIRDMMMRMMMIRGMWMMMMLRDMRMMLEMEVDENGICGTGGQLLFRCYAIKCKCKFRLCKLSGGGGG